MDGEWLPMNVGRRLGFEYSLPVATLTAGETNPHDGLVIHALSSAHAREAYEFILRCLTSPVLCELSTVFLGHGRPTRLSLPSSDNTFARLLNESRGFSKLELLNLEFDENTCPVLTNHVREGLEVAYHNCRMTHEGENALLESIQQNGSPRQLSTLVNVDLLRLAAVIRGSTTLETFRVGSRQQVSNNETNEVRQQGNDETNEVSSETLQVLLSALADVPGLLKLQLDGNPIDDESWVFLCQSFTEHPSLEVLSVKRTRDTRRLLLSPARKTLRTQALVEMMRVNTYITTIDLTTTTELMRNEHDTELLDEEVTPRLEMNRHRPRFRAVSSAPGAFHEALLGPALHAVNDNSTLLFMLLSSSHDIDWATLIPNRHGR